MRKLALSIIAIAFLSIGISAQDAKPDAPATPQEEKPNLFQQLGLNPDQLRQIRQLNQQRKPMIEGAQQRVRDANQALDQAIYADNVDENAVQARLDDLQQAQAEVARIRVRNEIAISRILTPPQLAHFRDLRSAALKQAAVERREQRVEQGKPAANNPNRTLRQMIREQNQQNRKLKSTPPTQAQPKIKN